MKIGLGFLAAICAAALTGCVSMNVAGNGSVGGVDVGANVDPIQGGVGANAGTTQKVGGSDTSVGVSTSGSDVNVDTNVQAGE